MNAHRWFCRAVATSWLAYHLTNATATCRRTTGTPFVAWFSVQRAIPAAAGCAGARSSANGLQVSAGGVAVQVTFNLKTRTRSTATCTLDDPSAFRPDHRGPAAAAMDPRPMVCRAPWLMSHNGATDRCHCRHSRPARPEAVRSLRVAVTSSMRAISMDQRCSMSWHRSRGSQRYGVTTCREWARRCTSARPFASPV